MIKMLRLQKNMKKTLYIFLLLIPFSAFAITQKVECNFGKYRYKNIISDKNNLIVLRKI